jgi:hypothetical protein
MKKLLITFLLVQACGVFATETVIINPPGGGQTVCIIQCGYVTCF